MKRLLILLSLFLSTTLQGALVEVKAGYFSFADSCMNDVYKEGGLDLQLSTNFCLWENVYLYGSAEFFERRGRSLGANERTFVFGAPLSVGLQAIFSLCSNFDFFVTVGPRYFILNFENDSPFVDRRIDAYGFGGFANTGVNICLRDNLLLTLFGEYSYKQHSFTCSSQAAGHAVQIGGWTVGLGVGYFW